MALPATDGFAAADGTALTTYSANWTYNSGTWVINTNSVYPNTGGTEEGAHWNADAFNNDQYAQVILVAVAANQWRGAAVRCHASTANYYGYYGSSADKLLFKLVSGSWTQIGSAGSAGAVNDILRLEVSGTTLTPKLNGVTDSAIGAQTDSAIASGSAGIAGYGTQTTARLDDWEGGNLGAAADFPPIPAQIHQIRRSPVYRM